MNTRNEKIKELYLNSSLTMEEIGHQCNCSFKVVFSVVKKTFSKEHRLARKQECYRASRLGEKNPMFGKIGAEHHNFKGRCADGKGYILVLKPEWYTGRRNSKHVFEHSVVMCEALGITEIPPGFVVHHIDHNRTNNKVHNLALLTIQAHGALHSGEKCNDHPHGE
jgi:hypothetical protein